MQHGGQEGFTVDYWRKVWRGDELIRDERYTHKYRPEDTIIEKGPEPEKPPEDTTGTGPTESGDTGPTESGPPPSSEGPSASEPPASSQDPGAQRAGGDRNVGRRLARTLRGGGYSSFRVAVPVASIDSIEPWKSSVVPISSSLPPSSGSVTCWSSASVARVSARSKAPPLRMSVV